MSGRVLYYDNCWFTNVGESFIDIGAMELIKKILPDSSIANISNMSKYYVTGKPKQKTFGPFMLGFSKSRENGYDRARFELANTLNMLDMEYVILAGMFVSKHHLGGKVSEFIRCAKDSGKKIIFLGLGEEPHIKEETIEEYKKYLSFLEPEVVMTRDKKTYRHFQETVNCIQGIDAAFWVKDAYDPRGFSKEKYDIVCYNRSTEPEQFLRWEYPVVRPYHFQMSYTGALKENTFISDIPYDYITLYANAHKVYTDLVHATIISLQYGKEVYYYQTDSRADAFLDMGCVESRQEGRQAHRCVVNEKSLAETKERIVETIKREIGR